MEACRLVIDGGAVHVQHHVTDIVDELRREPPLEILISAPHPEVEAWAKENGVQVTMAKYAGPPLTMVKGYIRTLMLTSMFPQLEDVDEVWP